MKLFSSLLLPLLALSLSGCLSDANLKLSYKPKPDAKSPLSTVKPLTVVITAQDKRDASERERIGTRKNAFGGELAKVMAAREVTSVIYEVLHAELEHGGHRVIATHGDEANLKIEVVLKRMWCGFKSQSSFVLDAEVFGVINSDVTLVSPSTGTILVTKAISGSYQESRETGFAGAYEDGMNGALNEFIHNFAYDPGVLKAFEQSSPTSSL